MISDSASHLGYSSTYFFPLRRCSSPPPVFPLPYPSCIMTLPPTVLWNDLGGIIIYTKLAIKKKKNPTNQITATRIPKMKTRLLFSRVISTQSVQLESQCHFRCGSQNKFCQTNGVSCSISGALSLITISLSFYRYLLRTQCTQGSMHWGPIWKLRKTLLILITQKRRWSKPTGMKQIRTCRQ